MRCNTRRKIFPSLLWLVLSTRLAKKGTTVSDTIMDANTDEITAKARLRINSPDASGKNASGINATIKAAVQPTTAKAICLVAPIAASRFPYPSRSQRSMFSTTTILSSTSKPSATTSPTMLNWLSE